MERYSTEGGDLIATPSVSKKIIREIGLPIKKSWGQNFLLEPSVVHKIVAAAKISASDHVFEVGPGIGGLSQILARQARSLTLIEIDPILSGFLSDYFSTAEHVQVLNKDALIMDFAAFAAEKGFASYKLVANLPYYITTPLLMSFLQRGGTWSLMVLMMQKEVAARIMAPPGGKDYGALSLAVQYRARVEKVMDVPPVAFMPRPEVDSTVLRLENLPRPAVEVADERLFFSLIGAAFAQRRKTLANALANGAGVGDKHFWQDCFRAAAIDGGRRGETLSLAEFALVANTAQKMIIKDRS
jgi:16S rRNA (adenine1518-N6/adenine1519-N6)-dimethyltransferase